MELESAGGAVQLVRTSAPTGNGLLELEEALLLQVRLRSAWSRVRSAGCQNGLEHEMAVRLCSCTTWQGTVCQELLHCTTGAAQVKAHFSTIDRRR